jgi:hypothetical protein
MGSVGEELAAMLRGRKAFGPEWIADGQNPRHLGV